MAATMRDVALVAGVSPKTVSNVLNGHPHVSTRTRTRVEAAVKQLDYKLNIAARNLRAGRSQVIMLALPELTIAYFAQLAQRVIDAASAQGLTVFVETTRGERGRELEVLAGEHPVMADGILLSPQALTQADLDAHDTRLPIVLLGERQFDGPLDHVTMANTEGARSAVAHLVAIGRRNIVVIGTTAPMENAAAVLRLEGARQALEEAGMTLPRRRQLDAPFWHRDAGERAIIDYIEGGGEVDAVFCFNDELALGALRGLHRMGRRVPEDVAVVGFDDTIDASYSTPSLTSVSPGMSAIAQVSIERLLGRMDHPAELGPARRIVADFELKVRESTVS